MEPKDNEPTLISTHVIRPLDKLLDLPRNRINELKDIAATVYHSDQFQEGEWGHLWQEFVDCKSGVLDQEMRTQVRTEWNKRVRKPQRLVHAIRTLNEGISTLRAVDNETDQSDPENLPIPDFLKSILLRIPQERLDQLQERAEDWLHKQQERAEAELKPLETQLNERLRVRADELGKNELTTSYYTVVGGETSEPTGLTLGAIWESLGKGDLGNYYFDLLQPSKVLADMINLSKAKSSNRGYVPLTNWSEDPWAMKMEAHPMRKPNATGGVAPESTQ